MSHRGNGVRGTARPDTWRCLEIPFQLWTQPRLTDYVIRRAVGSDGCAVVGYVNLHAAALRRRHPVLDEFYDLCDAVLLDGMAMTWVARLCGVPARRQHRITYVDWISPLLARAAETSRRVFYVGGRPGVGERAAARLRERLPGLEIATHHGYFDPDPEGPETRAVVDSIRRHAPHIVLVGMGMPRQEEWIRHHREDLEAGCVLAVGACMDYVAGDSPIPPRWAGAIGLEWLFRLVAEPRRLAFRYLVEPWTLLGPILRECLRRR